MSGAPVLDLFAGLGGWDVAARSLGIDPLGIECDDAACATREAVGLRTLRADVAAIDPVTLGAVWGLIGSPPCPTFSAAGGRAGRRVIEIIVRCLHELAAGADTRVAAREEAYAVLLPAAWEAELARARKSHRSPDRARAELRARRDADMSLLVVEPAELLAINGWAQRRDAERIATLTLAAALPDQQRTRLSGRPDNTTTPYEQQMHPPEPEPSS